MDSAELLTLLRARIAQTSPTTHLGKVEEVTSNSMQIRGLSQIARLGDELRLSSNDTPNARAEITRVSTDTVTAIPFGRLEGMRVGASVTLEGPPTLAPAQTWLGRVIDPFGRPLDGRSLSVGADVRPLHRDAPPAHGRRAMGTRLCTGISVLDTMLPLAKGQRIGLFAGSGVGKSTLLGQLARQTESDVSVVALIGERGRELREFLDKTLGPEGLARSVVIAATSDMPAGVRRRALSVAMSVAEYFRDQGAHVLFVADSITRFAEAHREVATATGEAANMRGFPPSLTQALAQICERAGPGAGQSGDITAVLSVLVAGSNMEEPVADILRGLLDGHIVMDRKIAEAGRFPAIDVLRSVSRCLPDAATHDENSILQNTRKILSKYDNAELMIQSGLYESGTDPEIDLAIKIKPALDRFFGSTDHRTIVGSFKTLEAELLSR